MIICIVTFLLWVLRRTERQRKKEVREKPTPRRTREITLKSTHTPPQHLPKPAQPLHYRVTKRVPGDFGGGAVLPFENIA
jgi:hypothetical protein